MAHSILLLATRVIVVMFFTGLVGCGTVVIISWISIFKDGFADLSNRKLGEDLYAGRTATNRDLSIPVGNTRVS